MLRKEPGDLSQELALNLQAVAQGSDEHTQLEIDLSEVTDSDSAGLALLLEWVTWANHSVREIRFTGVPEKVLAIARTTEVEPLLARGERWAGFIEAPESG